MRLRVGENIYQMTHRLARNRNNINGSHYSWSSFILLSCWLSISIAVYHHPQRALVIVTYIVNTVVSLLAFKQNARLNANRAAQPLCETMRTDWRSPQKYYLLASAIGRHPCRVARNAEIMSSYCVTHSLNSADSRITGQLVGCSRNSCIQLPHQCGARGHVCSVTSMTGSARQYTCCTALDDKCLAANARCWLGDSIWYDSAADACLSRGRQSVRCGNGRPTSRRRVDDHVNMRPSSSRPHSFLASASTPHIFAMSALCADAMQSTAARNDDSLSEIHRYAA